MKRFYISLLFTVFTLGATYAAIPKTYQKEPDKKEISASKLPEEARFDITDNYHGAQITKVYRLYVNNEPIGYLVSAQKGENKWSLKYDNKGNPVNKVNP